MLHVLRTNWEKATLSQSNIIPFIVYEQVMVREIEAGGAIVGTGVGGSGFNGSFWKITSRKSNAKQ